MSDKLIEIAKANGADIYLAQKGDDVYPCGAYLSTDQLRATVKQVCAPLVDFVEFLEGRNVAYSPLAAQQLKQYRTLIGDKE